MSPPPVTEDLDYYKRQYEQLEADLAEFQASSKELEEQLERDVEAAEKKERRLKQQVETLTFEVEEWKGKYQKSKAEANQALNALQKEVTELREARRAVEMRLRDTEVANDDYERQARHTESSLEDLESKCNVAIERSVLLDGELKLSERDREALRIDNQRLRDELGDLRVENDITLDKLRLANRTVERLRSRNITQLSVNLRPRSPASEMSGLTSPTASTPPPKSDSMSEAPTPPSPPLSDVAPAAAKTPSQPRPATLTRSVVQTTPRPAAFHGQRVTRRPPNPSASHCSTFSGPSVAEDGLPRSDSLYQIKQLRGRMQRIEERLQSARSKLPASRTPVTSPVAVSRADSIVPSSVTVRSKPSLSSTKSSVTGSISDEPGAAFPRRIASGLPRPLSTTDRPPGLERHLSVFSRTQGPLSPTPTSHVRRPSSRVESRPPDDGVSASAMPGRPKSGLAGMYSTVNYPPRGHRPSSSMFERNSVAIDRNTPSAAQGKMGPPPRRKPPGGDVGETF